MLKISVVVRALNEEEHLPHLITGLKNQSIQPDELILVDSGSTDQTVSLAEASGFTIKRLAPEDFSFGRALNLGFSTASGDIVVVLSAHVFPTHDNFLERLLEPFGDSEVAVSYGRQIGDSRTKFSEHQILRGWFPEESVWDQGHPFCNNANAAVKRSAWESLKYDESLSGLEDLEFAKRAQQRGWGLSYVSEATVVHVHEETWRKVSTRYAREAAAYKRIYPSRTLGFLHLFSLFLKNTFHDFGQARDQRVLLKNVSSIVLFRMAQFVGTWKGFRISEPESFELIQRFYYPPAPKSPHATPHESAKVP